VKRKRGLGFFLQVAVYEGLIYHIS